MGGPCSGMRAAIARGTIVLRAERACTENGVRFGSCPSCAGALTPATIAGWPWKALRAAGMP